jgi:2-polyprenyl-3-methyl-5-hydroxy-6-metoxy-1,4-benzoquinol methylase
MNCIVCNYPQKKIFKYKSYDYFRCVSCGLISSYPLPDEIGIKEHYEKGFNEGNYLRLRQWADQYSRIYIDLAHFLESHLLQYGLKLDGARFLDIGCFTGDFIRVLNKRGADVFGLELQKEAVEIANESLPGRIFQADVYNDVFPEYDFDIVSMTGLIEHVLEPTKLLHRCFEILKPGGVIMIQTPNSGSFLSHGMHQYWPPIAPVEHIYLFSRRSMEIILKICGFTKIYYKPHIKWLPIEYVYNNLRMFGPDLQKVINPIYQPFRKIFSNVVLPFYGGEMLMLAQKQ